MFIILTGVIIMSLMIKKVDDLVCFILSKPEAPDIIGISAGGTVAVNLLSQHPEIVKKVVTVCTPYKMQKTFYDSELKRAITELHTNLKTISTYDRERILALRATEDKVVPVPASQPNKIQTEVLPIKGHALTIAASPTIFQCRIHRFLSRKS